MSTPTPPGPPGQGQPGPSGPPPGWQPQNQPPQHQPTQNQPTQWTGYDQNRYQPNRPQDETRVFDPNGPGGFGGPPGYQRPPQRNRAGLFIVLLVVLLIAVLGIGGVVAYNLVSDKSPSSETTEPGGLDPSDIPTELPTYFPTEPPTEDPTEEPSVPATTAPTKPPSGNPAEAKALVTQFVGHLNANQPTAAAALACQESKELLPTLIKVLIKPPTKLTVGETIGQTVIIVRVNGTTNGRSVTGIVLVQADQSGHPCVRALQVAPN